MNLFCKLKKIPAATLFSRVIVLILALLFFAPFYISVVTALKTPMETAQSVIALPTQIQWENFTEAIRISRLGRSLVNSSITTFTSVFIIILSSSTAGYAIARNNKQRVFKTIELIYLAALMVPFQVIMIPVYRMLHTLNLLNSLYGLIVLLVGTSVPYATFLYIGFVKSVPKDLEEAALIDGCGALRTFIQIVFPLLKPITSTVASLHVLWLWNEFTISLITLHRDAVRTIPIQQFFFFSQYTINLNLGFASAVVAMLPVILFFLMAQKFIIEGVSAGAIKG
jgi:raffinose/stachyose/melibiose transport system permease protein